MLSLNRVFISSAYLIFLYISFNLNTKISSIVMYLLLFELIK